MEPLKLHTPDGVSYTRGPEFEALKSGTVLHDQQFANTPEAQPGKETCPTR